MSDQPTVPMPPYSPPPHPLQPQTFLPPPPPARSRNLNLASCLMVATLVGSMILNAVLFVALLAALGGTGGLHEDGTVEKHVSGPAGSNAKIVVIPIKGVISSGGASMFGGSVDMVDLAVKGLRRVKEDRAVVAVILDVNSPGGGITDCDRIHHEIAELRKARPELKFVSLMRDVAASGGYYVSAPCDRIIAHPTTITGSIGVIMSFVNLQGLFEKIGYREEVIKSGPHKDIGSMGRPMTEEERQILQGMLNEMYDRFVRIVATGRKMDEAKVRELADGRIYSGGQAKENGLVDELGYFEDAVEAAKKLAGVSDASVVEYQRPFTFADLFRAESKTPPAEAMLAAELEKLTGRRQGFYYLWTVESAPR